MLLRDKTYTSSQIIVFASNTSSSVMLNILSDFVITARDSIFQSLLYHLLSTVCSHVLAFLPLLLFLMIYRSLPIALGVLWQLILHLSISALVFTSLYYTSCTDLYVFFLFALFLIFLTYYFQILTFCCTYFLPKRRVHGFQFFHFHLFLFY